MLKKNSLFLPILWVIVSICWLGLFIMGLITKEGNVTTVLYFLCFCGSGACAVLRLIKYFKDKNN